MPPKGYLSGPDLAAQRAMWAKAESGPKDARGVAIDTQNRETDVEITHKERGEKGLTERRAETGKEAPMQDKLRQLQKDLREDEAAIAYNEMQISSLQKSLNSRNVLQLQIQIKGFENDKAMRLQRVAGFRRQIEELRGQTEDRDRNIAA